MRPKDPGLRVQVRDYLRAEQARSPGRAWLCSFSPLPPGGSTRAARLNRAGTQTPPRRVGTAAIEAESLLMDRSTTHALTNQN
jgi:hypothetical protein